MNKIYKEYYPRDEDSQKDYSAIIQHAGMLTAWFRLTSSNFNESNYLERDEEVVYWTVHKVFIELTK